MIHLEFASDNTGPAAPEILEAIRTANEGHAAPYGADPWTEAARARIREVFEAPDAEVFLVGTGTAANALALACLTRPWEAVFCHRDAHVQEDECGAPEFHTAGARLAPVDGACGRIAPEALARRIAETGAKGVHGVQRGPVTITNATEWGTVYTPDAVAEIAAVARRHGLALHMDGARLANAIAHLGCTPAEITWKAGVDVLSLGGTKNGLLGAEALVFFRPELAAELPFRRKRAGQLFSKGRFLGAQMARALEDGLWLELAARANAAARLLAEGIAALPGVRLTCPVEANMVFAALPRAMHARAMAAGAHYYLWPFDQPLEGDPDEPLTCRLVCDWSTGPDRIERLLAAFRG